MDYDPWQTKLLSLATHLRQNARTVISTDRVVELIAVAQYFERIAIAGSKAKARATCETLGLLVEEA